jgi:hypothetical protein
VVTADGLLDSVAPDSLEPLSAEPDSVEPDSAVPASVDPDSVAVDPEPVELDAEDDDSVEDVVVCAACLAVADSLDADARRFALEDSAGSCPEASCT